MKKLSILIIILIKFNVVNAQDWTAVNGGTNSSVRTLLEYNGNLIVGGDFDFAGGIAVNQIAKWNDTTWTSMGSIPNVNSVECSIIYNNELYAGGGMGLAKWSGNSWISITQGSWVNALAIYKNELYYTQSGFIKKWDGTNSSIIGTTNSDLYSLFVYNGDLIVGGGGFSQINGVPCSSIAKWDGTNWSSLGIGILNGTVYTITTFNGELFVGGSFNSSGGNVGSGIEKWNGVTWSSLTESVDGDVYDIDSIDGKLYVGGCFTSVGDGLIPALFIAVWDGSSWSTLGNGLNATVFTLKKYNGILYAGGIFAMSGSNLTSKIAKWDLSVGIKETALNDSKFKLYPNPATTQITIESEQTNNDGVISVSNLNGQEILKQQIKDSKTKVDISYLTSGVYFVKLITDKIVEVKKIIKE